MSKKEHEKGTKPSQEMINEILAICDEIDKNKSKNLMPSYHKLRILSKIDRWNCNRAFCDVLGDKKNYNISKRLHNFIFSELLYKSKCEEWEDKNEKKFKYEKWKNKNEKKYEEWEEKTWLIMKNKWG